jgi:two-component system NtrC family sensor kinase
MLPADRELAFFKFLDALGAELKEMREPGKVLRHGLREACGFFGASQGGIAVLESGHPRAEVRFAFPRGGRWDLDLLTQFIRHTSPAVPRGLLLRPIPRRGGVWGVLVLSRADDPYGREEGRLLGRVTSAVSDAVQRLDRERILGVRDTIERKLAEQLHPKDLFYQILHGLRSLTSYDHSSALLIREDGSSVLRLVAEQIAWTKAKSDQIGLRLPFEGDVEHVLHSERVHGFTRAGDQWREWGGAPVETLASLLDYNREGRDDGARESTMLVAPLVARDGFVGVLKVASRYPGGLRPYDADLVERFRAQAATAIENLHWAETLRARVVTAERKHAMAELARGVAHDVNNALGSMLPLVQQMQSDLVAGTIDRAVLADDLDRVHQSLQVCRRIFGGMLSFARGAARKTRHGHVRSAVDTVSAILKDGMGRRGIDLSVDVPAGLPPVGCAQTDLEQVFLNLLTNAREAMRDGGAVTVVARPAADLVEVSVSDTGCGIAAEHVLRAPEPFFTTKLEGSGLGLTICRSILWEIGGNLRIESTLGAGTCVAFTMPLATTQHERPHERPREPGT